MNSPDDSDLTRRVIGCAIEVHHHLVPGLLESIYEAALCLELSRAGIGLLPNSNEVRLKDGIRRRRLSPHSDR
jgi:GxxExxY protein